VPLPKAEEGAFVTEEQFPLDQFKKLQAIRVWDSPDPLDSPAKVNLTNCGSAAFPA